ncbi:MAG: peptidylprolyl isomerase, partial [Clostridia bacterium]|nr:peptidylprolyl isomerase [Clostridia bacterium]
NAKPADTGKTETDPDGDVILTLGEDEFRIRYTEYNYYFMANANDEANEGLSYNDITTKTIYNIMMTYAEKKLADKYGYTISDDQKALIDDKIQATKDQYSTEQEYKEALRKARLDEETMRKVLEYAQIDIGLREYVLDESSGIIKADDATVTADINSNFRRCKIIVFKTEDGDDNANGVMDKALQALQEYKNGADFDELLAKYNEDDLEDTENGYYFTKGMLSEEVEAEVENMEEGEVLNKLVKTDSALCIVQRLPLDESYVSSHFEELRGYYMTREYNTLVQDTANEMGALLCDNYDSYNFG